MLTEWPCFTNFNFNALKVTCIALERCEYFQEFSFIIRIFFSGVGIYEGVRVEGVDVESGRVTGVRTNKGNITCEIFVNCAGQVRIKQ